MLNTQIDKCKDKQAHTQSRTVIRTVSTGGAAVAAVIPSIIYDAHDEPMRTVANEETDNGLGN